MRLLFVGSAQFGCPTLQALIDSSHEIVRVVTQPARPAGRGLALRSTPIYDLAVKNHLDTYTFLPAWPEIQKMKIDRVIVVAYGEKIPSEIHDHIFCLNIHPSLLPKYRGASPLQSVLLNGETKTGVTIMLVAEKMDAGDIVLQKETEIDPNETVETLHDRLAQMGAEMMLQALDLDIDQVRQKQNEDQVSICRKIKKEDRLIDWQEAPQEIHNQVRAISGYTFFQGKRVKVWETRIEEGQLKILKVQPEGKSVMNYDDFVKGYGQLKP